MIKALFIILLLIPLKSFSENLTTLDDLLVKLEHHPILINKQQTAKYYQQLAKKEKGLPDPNISLGVENVPTDDFVFDQYLPSSKTIGFSQKIPAFGTRGAKSKIQKHLSKSEQLNSKFIFENLKMRLLTALVKKNEVRTLNVLAGKQLKLLNAKDRYLQGRLEGGGSTVYSRLSENDIDKSDVEQTISDLEFAKNEADLELVNLVGKVANIAMLKITMNNWDGNIQNILPILAVKEQLNAAKNNVKVKKAAFGPNLGISGKYKMRESGNNFAGDDWFSAGVSLSIPLWFSSSQLPDLRAANAKQSQIRSSYRSEILNWRQKIQTLQKNIQRSLRNIKLLKDKKKSLNNLIDSVSRNYESGTASYESVLDAKIYKMRILSDLEKENANYQKLIIKFNNYTAR